ncbi:MAG: DUF2179 domain-containing protein [Clostridia bacterium]|nr:DUF2179 domain-containing protein [Clostridia bacterium]
MEIILLCIKVFLCRILDVSLSTFRTVLLVKGRTAIAAAIAIVEAMVWFLVVREALQFEARTWLDTLNIAFAYAFGYSVGNIIGGELSKRISGTINVQIVTSGKDSSMIKKIQDAGFEITVIDANPSQYSGEKYIIFAVIKNTRLKEFRKLVYSLDEKAFILASETKIVTHAVIK